MPQPHVENPNVARARELVLRHGWNSTSFQIVNPGITRWFSSDGDAVVGYVTARNIRVVAGAPVCSPADLPDVTAAFEADAMRANERVCYFGAEDRLESQFADSPGHTKFLIGAQSVWHPGDWDSIVKKHRSIRSQINRARNKGVVVTEWPVALATDHPELSACLSAWLETKGLPPLHFMVESDTLSRLENRRIFVAQRDDDVVGFIVLSPVATRNGWLFEQFPHRPGAPNGTVECMIDAAMRTFADGGFEYATLGLSPLSTRADVPPFPDPLWLKITLAWLRKHGQRFYNFDGLDAFKAKLKPEIWEPIFAVSNEPRISFKTLYAIAAAFSGGKPIRLFSSALSKATLTELKWMKQKLSLSS